MQDNSSEKRKQSHISENHYYDKEDFCNCFISCLSTAVSPYPVLSDPYPILSINQDCYCGDRITQSVEVNSRVSNRLIILDIMESILPISKFSVRTKPGFIGEEFSSNQSKQVYEQKE